MQSTVLRVKFKDEKATDAVCMESTALRGINISAVIISTAISMSLILQSVLHARYCYNHLRFINVPSSPMRSSYDSALLKFSQVVCESAKI